MKPEGRPFEVGFLTCASRRVKPDMVLKRHQQAADQVSRVSDDLGLSLAVGGVLHSDDELGSMAAQIGQPSAVVLHYAGWTEDQTVLAIVDAFDCPIMLWVTDDVFVEGVSQLVAHVGYMEASAFLTKLHKRFFRYNGGPSIDSGAELHAFLRASSAVAELRGLRFGWIGEGYGSRGILDTAFDEKALTAALGVQFERIPLDVIFERYSRSPAPEQNLSQLKSLGVDVDELRRWLPHDPTTLNDSLRLTLVLADIAAEHNLHALSLRCFPEFRHNGVPSPCLAISALNQNRIPASCEGDVLSGVSMFVLSKLSGAPATMMDIYARDDDANTLELAHCGSAALDLARRGSSDRNMDIQYATHCKPANHRAGVTLEFALPPGRISSLKLDMIDDVCRLVRYQGVALVPDRR